MRKRLSESDDENYTVRHVELGRFDKSDQAWSFFLPQPCPCHVLRPLSSSYPSLFPYYDHYYYHNYNYNY